MPISFRCSSCQSTIRVPDGTEGKKTKCPKCEAIQRIPEAPPITPPPATPPEELASKRDEESESLWASLESEPTSTTASTSPNPFGDGPDPFGAPRQNPYSSPAVPGHNPGSRESARAKLMGPFIGVLISTILGVLLVAVSGAIQIANLNEVIAAQDFDTDAERTGFLFGFFGFYAVIFCVGLLTTIAMLRGFAIRSYGFVFTGFILAMTPCANFCFCFLAMPFSIWGIVVMLDDSVKSAFRLP